MSRLTDMEEILLKIESIKKREFMEEALTCYMNKAYRGCIVLSFIVMFEDIFDKLKPLTSTNSSAREIYDAIKSKRDKQAVFETDLINQLQSKNLIDKLDADFANIIIKLRNKSAHPSGHSPSPEEARYIFTEVVTRFLTQPILSTNAMVDSIVEKLKNDNFFIDNSMTSIKEVVSFETDRLHASAIPYLIDKLIENYTTEDQVFNKNVNFFISGFTSTLECEHLKILSEKVLKNKSTDQDFSLLILKLIGLRPELFKDSNQVIRERIKIILLNRINEIDVSINSTGITNPIYTIKSLSTIYSKKDFNNNFSDALKIILNKWKYEKSIKKILIDNDDLFEDYFKVLLHRAGSRTFDTANAFIENIDEVKNIIDGLISDKQSIELILKIIVAAENGARRSASLARSDFKRISDIYEKANGWRIANPSQYETICKNLDLDHEEINKKYFKTPAST
ncbi:MAG: hypothetical protein RSD40_05525 [Bacilli bacterium]